MKQILIIVTSCQQMGDHGKPTGVWAEELSIPYYKFIDAGYKVDIASPRGGPVGFDPASIKAEGGNAAETERLLQDPSVQNQLQQSLPLAGVRAADYAAVFLPGGHGTMWDLPEDKEVKRVIEEAYAQDKVIAAVCHGPAGLLNATAPDGKPILAGRKVNGFTNEEEAAVGLSMVVPFELETRMRSLGADFTKAAPWQPYAVHDGRLITGQNPQSSALVAQEVLSALAR